MKSFVVLGITTLFAGVHLFGQRAGTNPSSAVTPDFIQKETLAAEAAVQAATSDNDGQLTAALNRSPDAQLNIPPSLARLRRAAIACTVLRNGNNLPAAKRLAAVAITQIDEARESNRDERVEHLYWTAWLQSEILDDPSSAIALLTEAEALAPDDVKLAPLHARAQARLRSGSR